MNERHHVAIVHDKEAGYVETPPFNPSIKYPEYIFGKKFIGKKNTAYHMVRDCLKMLRMDEQNYGKPEWNPFSKLIRKGNTVVIKPNFVQDFHDTGGDIFSVITHGSIIRAIVDYVALGLRGEGIIYIADAPMMNSSFDNLLRQTGINEIADLYSRESSIEIKAVDLRVMGVDLEDGLVVRRNELEGDPRGYQVVDLAGRSMLKEIDALSQKLRGSDYDIEVTLQHHGGGKHEYLISNTALSADLFVNVPKLKTHKKSGITLNLKNLIGINGDKNWIPHYRIGGPSTAGDEFSSKSFIRHLESILKEEFKKFVYKNRFFNPITKKIRKVQKYIVDQYNITPIRSGAWYGNDTLWRSVIDLNNIFLHVDENGTITDKIRRKYFSIIDGIIGGEKEGPMNSTPKRSNVILGGYSPLAVDFCAVRLMGFDWKKIPLMRNAVRLKDIFAVDDFKNIEISTNEDSLKNILDQDLDWSSTLSFEPPLGWLGQIELTRKAVEAV